MGTTLAAVWSLGPRITANVMGLPFAQYRPSGAGAAIAGGNLVATIPAWITADANLQSAKPFAFGKPVGFAAVDPALTQVGDYLVGSLTVGGPTETFFIASQDIPAPIQVIRCNQVLTIGRPGDALPGPTYYSGVTSQTLSLLLPSWPAAVIQGTKGESGEVKLPGDTRMPFAAIMLPAIPGVELLTGDVANTAETTVRWYTLASVEITPLGYRMTASLANP
jgi:hypothetical protein